MMTLEDMHGSRGIAIRLHVILVTKRRSTIDHYALVLLLLQFVILYRFLVLLYLSEIFQVENEDD